MAMNVGEDNSTNEFYQMMMANVVAVGKFYNRINYSLSAKLVALRFKEGSDDTPSEVGTTSVTGLIKNLGAYAGLMDKAYGIKLSRPLLFSRGSISLGKMIKHGVMVHYSTKKMEAAVHEHAGNSVLNDAGSPDGRVEQWSSP